MPNHQGTAAQVSSYGTPEQVAEMLHTTTGSLAQDRYLSKGIPYVKHGRRVLYAWSDVYAYLDANTVTPGGSDAA
nr:helix-turn-helix domain-containing protein [Jongsikchunia kroppenstedtii]